MGTMDVFCCSELREIAFEITQRCPHKCVFCSSSSQADSYWQMPETALFGVLESARKLGTDVLSISGGEPTLHPALPSFLNKASAQGIACRLYSCGSTNSEDGHRVSLTDEQLRVVRDTGTKLILNVPTSDGLLYNKLTNGELSLLENTIEKAVEHGVDVEAHCVPMKVNAGSLKNTLSWLVQRGVLKVSFLRFVPQGRAADIQSSLLLPHPELISLCEELKSLAQKLPELSLRFGLPLKFQEHPTPCHGGHTKVLIRYDGTVFGCEAYKGLGDSKYSLGCILDTDLHNIWGSSQHQKVNERVAECHLLPGETCPAQALYLR